MQSCANKIVCAVILLYISDVHIHIFLCLVVWLFLFPVTIAPTVFQPMISTVATDAVVPLTHLYEDAQSGFLFAQPVPQAMWSHVAFNTIQDHNSESCSIHRFVYNLVHPNSLSWNSEVRSLLLEWSQINWLLLLLRPVFQCCLSNVCF